MLIDYEKLAKELAQTSKISSGILTIPSFAGRMLTARQITAVSQGASYQSTDEGIARFEPQGSSFEAP